MNAQEAEAAYRVVKSQFDAGQISLDDYNHRVAELRYQDNTGTWWSISPQDGSWLKWNGSTWVPAFEHAAVATPAPQPVVKPAYQQAQPAAQPSWYIPPVGAQQKPAAQPSYYIPPTGGAPAPAPVAYPTMAAAPVPAVAEKPKRNWLGIASLGLGILSWLFSLYIILGLLAIILGIVSLYTTKKSTGRIAVLAIGGIVIAVASILINYFYLFII